MTSPGVPGAADGTVPERAARATAGLVPGGLDWARAMDELAEEFLRADGPAGHAVTGLDAAIAVRREAIGRLDGDLAASAGLDLRNNLAIDLASRYQAGGGLADLLESCALSREVLAGATPGDLLTAAAGLAGRLSLLARNPGYEAELGEAIGLYEGLLADPAVAADARPAILSNLANGLLARFERDRTARARPARFRALGDIRRAAGLADEAISCTTPGSIHLAARHDTAGRLRAALGYHLGSAGTPDPGGAAEQGELAERHARAAAAATPDGSPDRAHYLNNWAMWVTDRWERTADPAALDEAIGLLEAALAAVQGDGQLRATISFNLGIRMQERFETARGQGEPDWDDLQRACDLLDDVLAAGLPHLTVPAGKRLGDIAVSLGMWPQAEHALRLALAALCAARAGDTAAAALHLEQASATLLAESLGVRVGTVTFTGITAACRAMRRSVLFLGATPAGGLAVLADQDGACQAAELLAGTGRLAVLPLGRLAWLPVTAAGPAGGPPALAPHEPVLLIRATAGPANAAGLAAAGSRPGVAPGGAGPRVLIWADTGCGDRAIPYVLDEARQVAALYPEARSRLHDRQDQDISTAPLQAAGHSAADATALLASADIVHLACHCDIDPGYPEETVLPVEALSPAAAFVLAGAGTVTASVWPVDDETAAAFMADYHRQLAVGTAPARALSQVQVAWSASRPAFAYAPWVIVQRPHATAAS
jgi:hypothetical protein